MIIQAMLDTEFVQKHGLLLRDRVLIIECEMIKAEAKRLKYMTRAAKSLGLSREACRKKLLKSEELLKPLLPFIEVIIEEEVVPPKENKYAGLIDYLRGQND